MPEEIKIEIPKEKVSPILHSLKKDTFVVSGEIVNNDAIPEEEAKMLASIQSISFNKRVNGLFRAMASIVIIAAIVLILLPNLFSNTKQVAPVNVVVEDKSLIKSDVKYILEIPKEVEHDKYRNKVFKSKSTFAELVLQNNSADVLYKDLAPFLNDRFIKKMGLLSTGEYVYGLYTGDDKISYPFLILKFTNNRDQVETALLSSERTLYNDMGVILQLADDIDLEKKEFVPFVSVRNPLRELIDNNKKTALVYGFANDEIVVFATSHVVYNAVKERILTGY